jgi:hypothetical protein
MQNYYELGPRMKIPQETKVEQEVLWGNRLLESVCQRSE